MAETTPMTGRCLGSACTFAATPSAMESGTCHCDMCRKWSGGLFFAVSCVSPVVFADDAPVVAYGSRARAERVFCRNCGTTVAAPAFDDQGSFPLTSEIFVDSKPETYVMVGEHPRLTKAQTMAKYAPRAGA